MASAASSVRVFEPNTDGVQLVVNPRGQIESPIKPHPRLIEIITNFQQNYKSNANGSLFHYSGVVLGPQEIVTGYNASIHMGDTSHGLCPFAVSCVLTGIAQENPDMIDMLDMDSDWVSKKQAGFVTPKIVENNEESLKIFSEELNSLFSKIALSKDSPKTIYIPCRFDNNDRTHWVLIAVEKWGQEAVVTYINTRGGNHESQEPENRTLIKQERVVEKAAENIFHTNVVRNPETPICLTTRSCGFDVIHVAEQLMNLRDISIAEFVSKGGLLQKGDLASTNPVLADLANRTRCAEKFISFLESWIPQ